MTGALVAGLLLLATPAAEAVHVVLDDAVGTPCRVTVTGRVLHGAGEEGSARSDARLRRLGHRVLAAGAARVPVEVSVGRLVRWATSDGSGAFSVALDAPGCALRTGLRDVEARPRSGRYRGVAAHGKALVVADTSPGLVVTDIDDTALVTDVCRPPLAAYHTLVEEPSLRAIQPGHFARCHFAGELKL